MALSELISLGELEGELYTRFWSDSIFNERNVIYSIYINGYRLNLALKKVHQIFLSGCEEYLVSLSGHCYERCGIIVDQVVLEGYRNRNGIDLSSR
jgi:hypothetical protein